MLKFILLALLFVSSLYAEVPNEITYQGRLREYGRAITGNKMMSFKIYTQETGGNSIWNSGDVSVAVSSGLFNYTLRPTGIDWRQKDLYIETTISNKILSPREKITAQAYALHSQSSEKIYSNTDSVFVIDGTTITTINSETVSINGNLTVYGNFNIVPAGTVFIYCSTYAPDGWLLCDGSSYQRSQYQNLFNAIGTSFGSVDLNSFNVPDFRGMFLRGWDNGAGIDPDTASRTSMNTGGNTGDKIGSVQDDQFRHHNHMENVWAAGTYGVRPLRGSAEDPSTAEFGTTYAGGNETRPKNANVNYIIKY